MRTKVRYQMWRGGRRKLKEDKELQISQTVIHNNVEQLKLLFILIKNSRQIFWEAKYFREGGEAGCNVMPSRLARRRTKQALLRRSGGGEGIWTPVLTGYRTAFYILSVLSVVVSAKSTSKLYFDQASVSVRSPRRYFVRFPAKPRRLTTRRL